LAQASGSGRGYSSPGQASAPAPRQTGRLRCSEIPVAPHKEGMPRRRRNKRGSGSGANGCGSGSDDGAAEGSSSIPGESRSERTAVFAKTKMCKFHIMGSCTKGSGCRFAHDRYEMQSLPDLSRTKLCRTLIETGTCNNQLCTYAHSGDELRPMPDAPTMTAPAPAQEAAAQLSSSQAQKAPVLAQPRMPGQQQQQAAFEAAMKVAIMQMGQAAAAHQQEAARLQAMALKLQNNGGVPTAIGPVSAAYAPAPEVANAANGYGFAFSGPPGGLGNAPVRPQQMTTAAALSIGGGGYTAARTPGAHTPSPPVLSATTSPALAPGTPPTHAQEAPSWGAKPAGHGRPRTESEEAECAFAEAMSNVPVDEPVQINTLSLRSLSSSSLPNVSEDDDMPNTPSPVPLTGPSSPTLGLMKAGARSSAKNASTGRLTALAEEGAVPSSSLLTAEGAQKRSQDTPPCRAGEDSDAVPCSSGEPEVARGDSELPSGGTGTTGGPGLLGAACNAKLEEADRYSFLNGALGTDNTTQGLSIKNTFLDFTSNEPVTALRAVQTASGRLDLMCSE